MTFLKLVCLGLAVTSLGACASITKGTDHTMAVNSNPQGADCTLTRAGVQIARVNPTPGQVSIDKSKDDIVVDCVLAGHNPAKHVAASEAEVMTAGNLIFGGLVGLAIDAGSGAINKYPSNVTVVMQRADSTLAPAPAAAPLAPSPAAPSAAPAAAPAVVASVEEPAPRPPVVYASEREQRPVTAVERMEQQAGPGYRNYRRKTSSYD